jgi:hypothetical protein
LEGSNYQRALHGWQTVGFGSPDLGEHRNIDLSQNKKVIRFMQKKTKGKTPKSKVEIPIHEALEDYLLSGSTSGALTRRFSQSFTASRVVARAVCRWRSIASWQKLTSILA